MGSFRSGGRRGVMEGIEQREEPPDSPGGDSKRVVDSEREHEWWEPAPFPKSPRPFLSHGLT